VSAELEPLAQDIEACRAKQQLQESMANRKPIRPEVKFNPQEN
jgi:hypothetical protein